MKLQLAQEVNKLDKNVLVTQIEGSAIPDIKCDLASTTTATSEQIYLFFFYSRRQLRKIERSRFDGNKDYSDSIGQILYSKQVREEIQVTDGTTVVSFKMNHPKIMTIFLHISWLCVAVEWYFVRFR